MFVGCVRIDAHRKLGVGAGNLTYLSVSDKNCHVFLFALSSRRMPSFNRYRSPAPKIRDGPHCFCDTYHGDDFVVDEFGAALVCAALASVKCGSR